MTVETLAPVTYQNIGVVTGFLLVPRGSGVVNIYNGDITNVLLVSPSSSPSLSNSVPIQPLTNATIDGSRAMYGSAQAGTLAQVVVSASAQISPSPAQIAQQISQLGLATASKQDIGTAAINNPAYGPSTAAGQTSQTAAINNPAYGPSTLARQIAQETNIPNNMAITGIPSIVPALLNSGNPVAANTSWSLNGGNPIQFTIGGAYELVLSGGTNTTAWVSDVTITHYDSSSNQTFSEVFTVSNWGNGTGTFGATIRGNLHGSYISVTGLSCAQAFITALIPSNPTVTSFTPRLYAIPYSDAPTPKIIPWTLSGCLRSLDAVALAGGGANTDGPLASYSGAAVISERNRTGGGFAGLPRILSYSVAGGSSTYLSDLFCPWSGSQWGVAQAQFALDMRFHTMQHTNASATVAGSYDVNVCAQEFI